MVKYQYQHRGIHRSPYNRFEVPSPCPSNYIAPAALSPPSSAAAVSSPLFTFQPTPAHSISPLLLSELPLAAALSALPLSQLPFQLQNQHPRLRNQRAPAQHPRFRFRSVPAQHYRLRFPRTSSSSSSINVLDTLSTSPHTKTNLYWPHCARITNPCTDRPRNCFFLLLVHT